jgi:uncharacterized RDD family membrane protein YckC
MSVFCTRCGATLDEAARFCPICGNPASPQIPPAPGVAIAGTPLSPPPVSAAPAVQYGGFWIRFLAVVIDSFLISAVIYPVSFIIAIGIAGAGYAVRMPQMGIQLVTVVSAFSLGVLGNWLYEALLLSSERQATVGKMILRLRVTDRDGQRIGFGQATARHFAKYLSGLILCIGYIMAAFTQRHQALHDMVAGTLVRRD